MPALLGKITGIAAYLVFVAGVGALCVNLTRHVGTQALVLAAPLVADRAADGGTRRITLVERRRIERGTVAERPPAITEASHAYAALPIPAPVLAAQLDLVEKSDLAGPVAANAPRGRRARLAAAKAGERSAGEIFGRSFGVMLVASR